MSTNIFKTKSFWSGIVGIIGGVGAGITTGDWVTAGATIWAGITTIFLRDALNKTAQP